MVQWYWRIVNAYKLCLLTFRIVLKPDKLREVTGTIKAKITFGS